MTTFAQAYEAIYEKIVTLWPDNSVSTIQFPNRAFTPPVGSRWLSVDLVPLPSVTNLLGGPGLRETQRRMAVYATVRVPAGTGDMSDVLSLAQTLANGLEYKSFSGLDFMEPASLVPTKSQDGLWYAMTVISTFVFYDTN